MGRKIALYCCLCLLLIAAKCENGVTKHTFNVQKNTIDTLFHSAALQPTFEALRQISTTHDSIFSLIHIGDSHIEIGQFSGEIKHQLEQKFGKSEEAWMFPYQFFNAQSQKVFPIDTTGTWKRATIKEPKEAYPVGITGLGFYLSSQQGELVFTKNQHYKSLHKISFLHAKSNIRASVTNGTINTRDYNDVFCISEIIVTDSNEKVLVHFEQSNTVIFALKINSFPKRGIAYHKFGVAGSTMGHFLTNAPLFLAQYKALHPKLLIVSLGTNDSYIDTLNEEKLHQKVNRFVNQLHEIYPNTGIIFTTAPDTKYQNKRPERLTEVNRIIRSVSESYGFVTLWDLQHVMGGDGSIDAWIKHNYLIFDKLHFTPAGYKLQGELFMQAFWKAYNKHVSQK
jgi:lysophospholipase L1-like esterase